MTRRLLRGLYRVFIVAVAMAVITATVIGPGILIYNVSDWFWLLYAPHAVGLLFLAGENV